MMAIMAMPLVKSAHGVVQIFEFFAERKSPAGLMDLMLANKGVCVILSEEEMRQLVKPENDLGFAQSVVERIVSRAAARLEATQG